MTNLVKIELPFSGFYNSIHDGEIEQAVQDGFNWNHETGEEAEITDEISDAICSSDVDWGEIQREYCEAFTEAFGYKFNLTLTFDEMTSPKEYNFKTDRIFCKVPRKQIDKLRKDVEAHEKYPQYIKDNFTSYDGFWSNYENDYQHEEWTRETLDECQYRVVIQFWLDNICDDMGSEGWNMEEWYLTNDFEMCGWDSVIKAHEVIKKYIKEKEADYAHCASCDKVINTDNEDEWKVINDNTYCTSCAEKEEVNV